MGFPRASGILLHPTSFPGRYGIGDLGQEAYDFVGFLEETGQSLWQVLPLGPTGYGDSPYQSFSAFAGNPLLISLDVLLEQRLLHPDDLTDAPSFSDGAVCYEQVIAHRRQLWPRVLDRFDANGSALHTRFDRFCAVAAAWL